MTDNLMQAVFFNIYGFFSGLLGKAFERHLKCGRGRMRLSRFLCSG